MAKRPVPPDPDNPPANTQVETTVPVTVGADKDALAIAETQNRQVGVDDSKENRQKLHDAAADQGTDVDLTVRHSAGEPLPAAAHDAIEAKETPTVSDATRAAMPGGAAPDPLSDGGLHEVTINNQTYTWRDGDEQSVPAEAVEVYKRAADANTP